MHWLLRLILWFDGGSSLPDGKPLVASWNQDSPPAVWSSEEAQGEWNRVS